MERSAWIDNLETAATQLYMKHLHLHLHLHLHQHCIKQQSVDAMATLNFGNDFSNQWLI